MTINVMKFNVFHYLLYSKHMNTLNKECWSKWRRKKEAGMFVKEEVFHQGTSITALRMKKRHCREPWRLRKLYAPVGSVLLYKHCSYPVPNTQISPVHKKRKKTHGKFLSLMRHSQKHVCLQSNFFSKLRGCHCTLFKPLHSGIDVSAQGMCSSVCVEATNWTQWALNV